MSQTKLVRKQLLLDQQDLFYVEQILKEQPEYISLSQYVRELLKKQIQEKIKTKNSKKAKLLAMAGCIKTNGNGFEAVNHNDIYKI
jgi:hypothetical protein